MTGEPVLFDVREAAAALGISDRTLHNWVRAGRIHAKKVGGRYVFLATEVARAAREPRPKRGRPRKRRAAPQAETLPDAS